MRRWLFLALLPMQLFAQEPSSQATSQPTSAPASQPNVVKGNELLDKLLTDEEASNPTSSNIVTKTADVELPSLTYDRSLILSFLLSASFTAAGHGLLALSITQKIDGGAATLSDGLALDPLSGAGYGLVAIGPSVGHLYSGRRIHSLLFTSARVVAGAGVVIGAKAIDNHCVDIGGCDSPLDFLPQAGLTVLSVAVLETITVLDVLGSLFAPRWRKRLLERRDNRRVIILSEAATPNTPVGSALSPASPQ